MAPLDRGDETQLIEFAEKHGQSLEWILTGDLVPMLRKFAAGSSSRTNATTHPTRFAWSPQAGRGEEEECALYSSLYPYAAAFPLAP